MIMSMEKPISYSIVKESQVKNDFVSVIQKLAKGRPGPSSYKMEDNIDKKSVFMSKSPNISYMASVIKTSKSKPGVGKYDTMDYKKKKIIGSYTFKEEGMSMIDEAIAKGQASPGHKNPIDLELIKRKINKPFISKETQVTDLVKAMKNKIKSPSSV